MPKTANTPDEETVKLEKCAAAIHYIAGRIRTDEKVRYLMGFGTQSFDLLTEALAGLCDVSKERATEYLLGETDDI
jgi:hypothetical protein